MTKAFLPGSYGGDPSKLEDGTRLECKICWYVYDPTEGDPHWQVPPGTPFAALPVYWTCPECDGRPQDFMVLES